MRGTRRAVFAAVAAAAVTAPAGPAAAQGIAQIAGEPGCVVQPAVGLAPAAECARGAGLIGATGVAVAPDGGHVYVAAPTSDAVAILARDPVTGGLAQLGCVSDDGGDGRAGSDGACADGDGLAAARAVAVSPDGGSVYVAGAEGSLASFARDPGSGALRQIGCFRTHPLEGRCTAVPAMDGGASVVVSPDGRDVYLAAATDSAVWWFPRDPSTGALRPGGCTSDSGSEGACADGTGLRRATALAVSPDGHNLYVAAPGRQDEGQSSGGIATFRRDGGGPVAQTGCVIAVPQATSCDVVERLEGATSVAVAPDGVQVLAVSDDGIVALSRDSNTGALGGEAVCVGAAEASGCAGSEPLIAGARSLAISPGGSEVAVAGGVSPLVVFGRNTDSGALERRACIGPQQGCAAGRGSSGATRVAYSPDGSHLYLTAGQSRAVGAYTHAMTVSVAHVGRSGLAVLRVGCPRARTTACRGQLVLARRLPRARSRSAAIGRSPFRVRPGRSAVVRVRLSRASRRVLARRASLGVVAVLDERAGGTPVLRKRIVLKAKRR